jgi:heme-degrading monooxygenase HmoA
MIAVIFELRPRDGAADRYFELAAGLAERLAEMDGFISVERFRSVSDPGKFVSLSFWRDEAAVAAWRGLAEHRSAQQEGRGSVFADYRLRVAAVLRDYGMHVRDEAPADAVDRAADEG